MSFEERVLKFNGFKITLSYTEEGATDGLLFEYGDGQLLSIRSKSFVDAPERIYELLRECEVTWRTP